MNLKNKILMGIVGLVISTDYWIQSNTLSKIDNSSGETAITVSLNNNGIGIRAYGYIDSGTKEKGIKLDTYNNDTWISNYKITTTIQNIDFLTIDMHLNESNKFVISWIDYYSNKFYINSFSGEIINNSTITNTKTYTFSKNDSDSCNSILGKIDNSGNIMFAYQCLIKDTSNYLLYTNYYKSSSNKMENEVLIGNIDYLNQKNLDVDKNGNYAIAYSYYNEIYGSYFSNSKLYWSEIKKVSPYSTYYTRNPIVKIDNYGKIRYFWVSQEYYGNKDILYREYYNGNFSEAIYIFNGDLNVVEFDAEILKDSNSSYVIARLIQGNNSEQDEIVFAFSDTPIAKWNLSMLAEKDSDKYSIYSYPKIALSDTGISTAWYYNNFDTWKVSLQTANIGVFKSGIINTKKWEKLLNKNLSSGLIKSNLYESLEICHPTEFYYRVPSSLSLSMNNFNNVLIGYETVYSFTNANFTDCGFESFTALSNNID